MKDVRGHYRRSTMPKFFIDQKESFNTDLSSPSDNTIAEATEVVEVEGDMEVTQTETRYKYIFIEEHRMDKLSHYSPSRISSGHHKLSDISSQSFSDDNTPDVSVPPTTLVSITSQKSKYIHRIYLSRIRMRRFRCLIHESLGNEDFQRCTLMRAVNTKKYDCILSPAILKEVARYPVAEIAEGGNERGKIRKVLKGKADSGRCIMKTRFTIEMGYRSP
ncbi:hypothetical protein ACTXT7_006900 [Hymenolepis weldensis]